jgi:PPOX class probable F420-dependent enzyme
VPKQRRQIRMTTEEVFALLEECRSLQVATLNRDGSPHLTTLWFAVVDGAIVFETFSKSQKIVNLKRDPRIAVLVEAGATYGELRGVSINAKAELVEGPERVQGLAFRVMQRHNPGVPEEQLRTLARQMARKRTAVVVRPEKVVSWDHRKIVSGPW